jgi:hypothetical protein
MRRGVSSFMDMPTMKISSHGLVICIGYPCRALAWQVRYVCLALASQKNKYSKSRNTKSLYQALWRSETCQLHSHCRKEQQEEFKYIYDKKYERGVLITSYFIWKKKDSFIFQQAAWLLYVPYNSMNQPRFIPYWQKCRKHRSEKR